MNSKTGHIRRREHTFLTLDGLRGVAAISVMLYHYSIRLLAMHGGFHPWLPNAFLAVDFFFVLSGFVIAHAYEKKLLAGHSGGQFMLRRLIRLYPLFFFGLMLPVTATFATGLIDGDLGPSRFSGSLLPSIFFLPAPPSLLKADGPATFPLNDPAWTLSLEIFINLVFALIWRRLTTPRLGLLVFLGGTWLAFALWSTGEPNLGWRWSTYAGGWARVTFSFFAGILLYRLYNLKRRPGLPAWIGAALAAIMIANFARPTIAHEYTFLSCILLFPAIVWVGAQTAAAQAVRPIYAWFGQISYAVYIIHQPLLTIYLDIARRASIDLRAHAPVAIILCAISSLAIASWLDAVYDKPVRAYLTKKLMPARQKRDIPGEHAPAGTGE